MANNITPKLVEKWLKGWCMSRKLPLPTKFKTSLKVDVGYEKQKMRYVFSELNDDFIHLAESIDEPWIFLKVCSAVDEVKLHVSKKWGIQPQSYMMSCFSPMDFPNIGLSDNFKVEFENYNSTFVIKIVTQNDELASTGRVVLVEDLAVFDRISTEENYRRNGLATFVMKELEKIATSNGVFKNFLVATEEGKSLYQSLGWEIQSFYTSIVIK